MQKGVTAMKRPILPEEETMLTGACTEMTGLIPSGRPDPDERNSYQDVLPWLPGGKPLAPC